MSAKRLARIVALAGAMGAGAATGADPVKIGLVVETTGAYAEYARESTRGATLALEEVNRAGGVLGRTLELVTADNESTNPGSVVAATQLVANRDVKAIITTLHSTHIQAMMPVIAQARIPALIGGTSHALTQAKNPWIFRVRPHDGYSARAIADFGVNTLGRKRWAIVYAAESFGIDAKDRLVEELKGVGLAPVAVHGVNPQAQNFAPVAQALKRSDIDVVATYFSANAVGAFARQLRQAGVDTQLIGSTSLSSPRARKLAGGALDQSYSVRDFVPDSNAQARAFGRRYTERWGEEPDVRASWVYDAVHLLAAAMNKAGSTSPDALRRALLATRGHQGTGGAYTFDANGDGRHDYTVVRNEGEKTVTVRVVSYAPR
ncbi:ABC transporter substrate-binding protein [Ramlibacter albus]|uniref:ABC transporter substrate-binding protein n=1 Tax=Ramlibacter albus TaxID=2079448 RepID=A0A923M4L8_9BURK|nr:ABC transporter substrate-binding protein [Ramlibacter albus]MBC5763300.1 ABC transporter substrate-binding protein [Ramlibacter albus]